MIYVFSQEEKTILDGGENMFAKCYVQKSFACVPSYTLREKVKKILRISNSFKDSISK